LQGLPPEVGFLEVRGDVTGDLDPTWLRRWTGRKVLYRLRAQDGSGRRLIGEAEWRERLRFAARLYDLVELDVSDPLDQSMLEVVPSTKRVIAYRGSLHDRDAWLGLALDIPGQVYKFVDDTRAPDAGSRALSLVREAGVRDLIAFAAGAEFAWTRTAAVSLGAGLVFARLPNGPGEDGEPTVDQAIAHLATFPPTRRGALDREASKDHRDPLARARHAGACFAQSGGLGRRRGG
jgi:hypothetical protein